MEVGNFHDAISKTLTYGVCIHQGECHPALSAPWFNLKQLKQPMVWTTLGWMGCLNKLIQSHLTILSVIVIVIESGRVLIFIFLLVQASVLHGRQAAQAIIYTLCCNACQQSQKLTRHTARQGGLGKWERRI